MWAGKTTEMIVALFFILALANVYGRPQFISRDSSSAAIITVYERTDEEDGQYSYRIVTSDGQEREETRGVLDAGTPNEVVVIYGSYSYYTPDGKRIYVSYTVDKNSGFRATGEHLPNSANAIKPQNSMTSSTPGGAAPGACIKSLTLCNIG